MKKRIALFTVCLFLLLSLLPATVFAVADSPSADLSISPATSKELETAVYNALKQAVKQRKNETASGAWPQTSFTVAIDFSDYQDDPLTINPENNTINTDNPALGLELFDMLSDDPDLDYECLVLKGGETGENINTFNMSFSISYDFDYKVINLTATYTLTWGESKSESAAVSAWCKNVVSEIITSDMSDYEKFKTLHDYVVDNFAYATEELAAGNQNIYYPRYMLANGRGVCQAYTALYLKLCQTAGLTVRAVRHETQAKTKGKWENHAWNLVKLEGKWYHVDVTWDDTAATTAYFLKSDSTMKKNHSWRENFYPAASSNYVAPTPPTSSVASSEASSSETSSDPTSSTSSSNPTSSTTSSNPTSSTTSSNPTSSTTASNPASSTASSDPTSSTASSDPTSSVTSSEPTSSGAASSETSSEAESADASDPADSSDPEPISSDGSSEPASEASSETSETSSETATSDVAPSQSSVPVNSSPESEKSIFTLSPLLIVAVVALTALVVMSVSVIIISKKKK